MNGSTAERKTKQDGKADDHIRTEQGERKGMRMTPHDEEWAGIKGSWPMADEGSSVVVVGVGNSEQY